MVHSKGDLYELGRKAGLSHETASDFVRDRPTHGAPLSGAWPRMAPGPTEGRYDGRPATIDAGLWLFKMGRSLCSPHVQRKLIEAELPIVVRTRVRMESWWRDGCLELDLERRSALGAVTFSTVRVPVGACIDHDMEAVGRLVNKDLGERHVALMTRTLYEETDLRHVAG